MINGLHLALSVLVLLASLTLFNALIDDRSEHTDEVSNIAAKKVLKQQHLELEYSYFPWPLLENGRHISSGSWKVITTKHDPRLMPALWLDLIKQQIEGNRTETLILPFQWQSWVDLSAFYDDLRALEKSRYTGYRSINTKDEDSISHGIVPKIIMNAIDCPLTGHERAFVSASFLLHQRQFTPKRAILIGLCLGYSTSIVVKLRHIDVRYQRTALTKLIKDYIVRHPNATKISLKAEIETLQTLLSSELAKSHLQVNADMLMSNLSANFSLEKHAFEFPEIFTNLLDQKNFHGFDDRDKLFKSIQVTSDHNDKYFKEAHILKDHHGFHFDWRFFKKSSFSSFEQRMILHRTARAWLRFSRSANLTSWLAHGTLLGWYWNGMNFPWDEDIDVQMTARSLFKLARNFDKSIVVDYSCNESHPVAHLYYIDVNPHFMHRDDKNRQNIIDARFIDISSGMYVDITGLTVTSYTENENEQEEINTKLLPVVLPEYSVELNSASDNPEKLLVLNNKLKDLENHMKDQGDILSCKNRHFYTTEDLSPLLLTTFEGELTFVPMRFERILEREYKKGLIHKHYNNWSFRPYLGVWLPDYVCKGDHYGHDCDDEESLLEVDFARDIIIKKSERFANRALGTTGRIDTFILQRNSQLCQLSQRQSRS